MQHGFFGSDTVSGFYFGSSKKALIEELWFDLVDELAVLLNREVTKEEIRITGIKPSAAHYTKNETAYFERNGPPDPLKR